MRASGIRFVRQLPEGVSKTDIGGRCLRAPLVRTGGSGVDFGSIESRSWAELRSTWVRLWVIPGCTCGRNWVDLASICNGSWADLGSSSGRSMADSKLELGPFSWPCALDQTPRCCAHMCAAAGLGQRHAHLLPCRCWTMVRARRRGRQQQLGIISIDGHTSARLLEAPARAHTHAAGGTLRAGE